MHVHRTGITKKMKQYYLVRVLVFMVSLLGYLFFFFLIKERREEGRGKEGKGNIASS